MEVTQPGPFKEAWYHDFAPPIHSLDRHGDFAPPLLALGLSAGFFGVGTGGNGLQYHSAKVYGPHNIGDWLWVETTGTGGTGTVQNGLTHGARFVLSDGLAIQAGDGVTSVGPIDISSFGDMIVQLGQVFKLLASGADDSLVNLTDPSILLKTQSGQVVLANLGSGGHQAEIGLVGTDWQGYLDGGNEIVYTGKGAGGLTGPGGHFLRVTQGGFAQFDLSRSGHDGGDFLVGTGGNITLDASGGNGSGSATISTGTNDLTLNAGGNTVHNIETSGATYVVKDHLGSPLVTYTGTRSVSYGPSITFSFGSNILHDVTDPASLQDVATKNYVDTHTSSGGVTSIQKTGSASITGSVTFSEGTNIAITQSGHDLTIASTASGGGQAGVPSLTLSTANSIGTATSFVASNATVALFDTTVPTTQAFGDAAAVGTAAFAARRDHKHAMPATPVTTINKTGSTALTGAVTLTGGTNVTLTQSGQDISIAASGGGGTQGTEIGYDQITGTVTVSSNTESSATTVITCAAHTFDGSPVMAEFFAPYATTDNVAGHQLVVCMFESTTQIGRIANLVTPANAFMTVTLTGQLRFTPSAGSHTYIVSAWQTSGSGNIGAGAGGTATNVPAFIRFTKV